MADGAERLIIDPDTGDTDRAEDIIMELVELCKRHNLILKHEPHAIVIAKVEDPLRMRAKAIAAAQYITPRSAQWDKIRWSAGALGKRQIS